MFSTGGRAAEVGGAGVEVFGFELGDEVFVTELGLLAVGGYVVLEGRIAGDVHVAGVPLVGEGGDRVDAPMEEDTEFGVAEPVGGLVAGERVPRGMVEG